MVTNSEFYIIIENDHYLHSEWDGYNFAFIWYLYPELADIFDSYEDAKSFIKENEADLSSEVKIQKCKATYILEDC